MTKKVRQTALNTDYRFCVPQAGDSVAQWNTKFAVCQDNLRLVDVNFEFSTKEYPPRTKNPTSHLICSRMKA